MKVADRTKVTDHIEVADRIKIPDSRQPRFVPVIGI